jgi:hypothetical protein
MTILKREKLDSNKVHCMAVMTSMVQAYAAVSPKQLASLLQTAEMSDNYEALMELIGPTTLNEFENVANFLTDPFQLGKAKTAVGGGMYKLIGALASLTRPSETRGAQIWGESGSADDSKEEAHNGHSVGLSFALPCVISKDKMKRMLQLSYGKLKESFGGKKTPDTGMMLGAFWCISEIANVCPSFFKESAVASSKPKGNGPVNQDPRGELLFQYIMTVLTTFSGGTMTRYEVVRVVLSIVKNHSRLLRIPLCEKAVQVYSLMYNCLVGKQCQLSQVNQLLEACIFKIVSIASGAVVYKDENGALLENTGDFDNKVRKKIFNQFMGEFTSLITEGVSKQSKLDEDLQVGYGPFGVCKRIGVYGIGCFAKACKINLGVDTLAGVERQLWLCIDNIANFLDVSESSGNSAAWAIGRAELLSSISNIVEVRVTRELSESTVAKIQEELIALVVAYPTQWKTKRWVLSKAIADILNSFGTDASITLTKVVDTVVHHALIRSISMSESREETNQMEQMGLLYDPNTGLVDIRLLHSYVTFWNDLISPRSYFWNEGTSVISRKTMLGNPSPQLQLPTMLCDRLITEVIELIAHFDLTFLTRGSTQSGMSNSTKQLHASLSLHVAPSLKLSKSASVSSQVSSSDGSVGDPLESDLQSTAVPRSPGDQILFNNLTTFLETIFEFKSENEDEVEPTQDQPDSRLCLLEQSVIRNFVPFFSITVKQSRLCSQHGSLYKLQRLLLHIAEKHRLFDDVDTTEVPDTQTVFEKFANANNVEMCFQMVKHQLVAVSKQFDSFSDDILICALRLVLNAPARFIKSSVRHYIPVLRRALLVGLTHEATAHAALSALHKCYDVDGGRVMSAHAHEIFPLLEPYLMPQKKVSLESNLVQLKTNVWGMKSDAMKKQSGHILKQTKVNKTGVTSAKGPVSGIQNKVMRFLGRVGGQSQEMLASGQLLLKKSLAWDPDALSMSNQGPKKAKQVNVRLPFPKSRLDINMVGLLPRLTELATEASDRQTKVAAGETLHAILLHMIGESADTGARAASGDRYEKLYLHLFPAILMLATDGDSVIRQLYRPFVFQLSRWYSNQRIEKAEAGVLPVKKETMAWVNGLMDGLQDSSNAGLVGICSLGLGEFFKYSIKQRSKKEMAQDSGGQMIKLLIRRLSGQIQHPTPQRRIGGLKTLNFLLKDLVAESSIISRYLLEILKGVMLSLRICHYDPVGIETLDAAKEAKNFIKGTIWR